MSTALGFTKAARSLDRFIPNPKLRFLDQCREVLRFRQMAWRTEQSYVDWIRRFIVWSGKRHPREMGAPEVRGFLTHLAAERNVAAATQNQALNALVFLYREVIGGELEWLEGFEPAKRGARLPEVLNRAEVQAVLAELKGTHALIGRVLYGTGVRLLEGLRLRVKDIDFPRGQIVVRAGKGDKDRVTTERRRQLSTFNAQHSTPDQTPYEYAIRSRGTVVGICGAHHPTGGAIAKHPSRQPCRRTVVAGGHLAITKPRRGAGGGIPQGFRA